MRAKLSGLLFAACLVFMSAGCGEVPDVSLDDTTKTSGSTIIQEHRYYSNYTLVQHIGIYTKTTRGQVDVYPKYPPGSLVGQYAYQIQIVGSGGPNVGLYCQLFLNWAPTVGTYPVSPPPPGIPYVQFGTTKSHWVTGSSYSGCKLNGQSISVPAGAVEFWETDFYPAELGTAAYLVFRFPGFDLSTAAVIRPVG